MMAASTVILVDTNVLVYPYDPRDRSKQLIATDVVSRLVMANRIALSVQCLTEFYRVATRRLPEPLSAASALERIQSFSRTCTVFDVSLVVVMEASRAVTRYPLQFWDALIWSVAKLHQIPYILTEDAEHGHSVEEVTYLNPFDPAFDVQDLTLSG